MWATTPAVLWSTSSAWLKLRPGGALVAEILAAVERQRGSPAWEKDGGRYIPNPATWLHGRRWEDEVTDAALGRLNAENHVDLLANHDPTADEARLMFAEAER